MANFKFSKSEFSTTTQEDWGWETVGVFGEQNEMKGKRITFTKRNLKSDNAVTIQIFPKRFKVLEDAIKADQVEKLSCTKPLSKLVRKALSGGASHNKVLSYLTTLEIQTNIDNPQLSLLFSEKGDGEALPNFLIEDLQKEDVSLEDLVAF